MLRRLRPGASARRPGPARCCRSFRDSFAPPGSGNAHGVRALRDAADAAAQEFLAAQLAEARPDDAVLSEEAADSAARDAAERVWIIDPLDGTYEYGSGRSDWAVHVALWERTKGRADGGELTAAAISPPTRAWCSARTCPLRSLLRPLAARCKSSPREVGRRRAGCRRRCHGVDLGGAWRPAQCRGCAGRLGRGEGGTTSRGARRGVPARQRLLEWDVAAPLAVARAAGLHAGHLDGSQVMFNQRPPYVANLAVCRP